MTVFMRAVPGLLQLVAELAPSLARRHSRSKAAFIRAQLKLFSMLYRAAEPLLLSMAKAGVPTPSPKTQP